MNGAHFILATAGHVDHGKSSLVKALTGTDPDRLPEEKARGITIDLGFAHLELQSTVNKQPMTFHLGLVDVPGHEDFVKNMVAGVGSIDLALLIVAADDGWMPQTEEHLQILAYLGVTHAVVALTKIDLAQDERTIITEIRAKLASTPFAEAPIVPTSIVTDRGLEELKATLAQVLSNTPAPRNIGKPRLPVDRVFVLRGVGTVVTGTLTGGELRRGQPVIIQPSGKSARIRSIQSHNQDVEASGPGTRTALNLPDMEASSGVQRGDVITLPELGNATATVDVVIEKSGRLETGKSTPARPLKNGTRVRIHLGSANAPAHVFFLDAKTLSPGERVLAQVRFESPVFALAGDRFIVRDWPEQATLAGGVVLCADAQRRQFRRQENRLFLQACAQSPDQASVFVQSQLARDGTAVQNNLLIQSRFSQSEIVDAATLLIADKKAVVAGKLIADAPWWQMLRQSAIEVIEAAHRRHPEHPGLPLNELRAKLKAALLLPDVFDALVRDLCRSGFAQAGVAIGRADHRPALPPDLQGAGAKLRTALAAKPLDPPSVKELAPDPPSRQALRFLLQAGEAVEVSEDVVLLADSLTRATEELRKFLREHRSATAGELRQALGTSRRIIIPLLERLDKEGLTRREGDRRVLKKT